MPTQQHEYLLELVQQRPSLVATLLAEKGVTVPAYQEARLDSCDMTERVPTEYRADSVVVMVDKNPVSAVVLEVQREYDHRKTWSWPVYLATLRGRVKCPCILLVFCPSRTEATKCAQPIDMGHPGWTLHPIVLGPDEVPMVTEVDRAIANPELMALSAIVHGAGDDGAKVLQVMHDAHEHLSEEQQSYSDLVLDLLPKDAVNKFKEIQMAIVREYKTSRGYRSSLVRSWVAAGVAEGEAMAILRILSKRGIPVPIEVQERILDCIDSEVLETWIDRALDVSSVDELFD
ncbi:hypothetical protein [Nonomuraea jiangxiensis]|uniref:Transposase, YhgA-like n=1 Tax=Nonomuraea jiangxiensis TaxID=633440 RepID=A0A1G8FFD0_9ACTN|nr:hypothetical protein [Nonomuraea jiangxiensis]SDH80816.1 hypothetical protein SAMN05421869_103302 [Nonomuraea jiangxiensis]